MSTWHEEQFGTPSTVTEQDAVRDAYVAELEAALRTIAAGVGPAQPIGSGVGPGFNWLPAEQLRAIAADALGLAEVQRIPDGVKWPHDSVAFIRYPGSEGEWHLIGPAVLLEPGTVVEVKRFTERDKVLVAVGRVVAERTVIHRERGAVQYVVTRVSRATREE